MNRIMRIGLAGLVLLMALLAVRGLLSAGGFFGSSGYGRVDVDASEPEIDVQLLDVNPYSRPGTQSSGITGIVIHYTANPGSSAQDNRDYFNGLQDSHETQASSNFVVGLDGEIIQCVPTWEVAYASNDRNYDSVSIEVCHPDETGRFTKKSYESLVQLTAWLCVKFDLTADDVIRHYDVTGKNCPKYFVEHEDAWEDFRENVSLAITSEN
jgi:N-acetylmuramoyl-L-alanine amidase CwlA